LTLGGDGAGTSTFAGDIGNGSATALNLTKSGSSTWVLSGDNTYTGTTTVTGGTLRLVGGSQDSAITVNNGATLGFTLGSPTTSTKAVTLNAGHKIAVTGSPDGTSDYLLMTATSFSGTPPVLDPPAAGYSLEVQGSGTQLVLVAPAPSATLVIDLGTGTVIEGGAFGTFGATNLPIPALPVGSILRSVSLDAAITATDNANFASDLAILFDPTPGGDFSLRITSGAITFGATNQLAWSGGASPPPATLVDTKNDAEWAAVGPIDLATYGIFLGNAYQDPGWISPEGGTWSGTITLTYDLVGGGNPFDTWAGTGTLGPVTFDGDTNGDGVQDGMAFLLGVANPDDDANGSLPTLTETGGNLVMQFNCLPTADRGTAELRVAHSSTLASFTTTVDQVPDADDAVPDNDVTFVVDTVSEAPLNKITATIGSGAAAGGKLFGRLTAVDDVAP
jgi:autotransporter-associated beta strand protein